MLVHGCCGGDVGARGGVEGGGVCVCVCDHMGEAWLRPIPTVCFRVEIEGSPNNFCQVHSMPMMKVGRIFLQRG